jgi:enamine deaminase RidA (YjgF/YER057c/UK114 family)
MRLPPAACYRPLPPLFVVLLAACVAGGPGGGRFGPGGGMEPAAPRYVNPGTLAALPGFTHAVRVGSTVYVSGEVALDSTGQLVGPGDLRAQARQAFANLALVLKIAGAVPADVTKLTIYVVNYSPRDFAVIREAGAEFLPERNPPAGIVLGVQALPRGELLIAVDAVAVVRAMFRPLDERDRR